MNLFKKIRINKLIVVNIISFVTFSNPLEKCMWIDVRRRLLQDGEVSVSSPYGRLAGCLFFKPSFVDIPTSSPRRETLRSTYPNLFLFFLEGFHRCYASRLGFHLSHQLLFTNGKLAFPYSSPLLLLSPLPPAQPFIFYFLRN